MEYINFEGVNLAELLPRIPDAAKDALPFGMVKLDLTGKILEYNMAEGDLTGVDPKWAIGKNFFDDVALCTKTQAFYGKFLEGVKRGFLNSVFDYTFDHGLASTRVKVHMITLPDAKGQKTVVLLVTRVKPAINVVEAFQDTHPVDKHDGGAALAATAHVQAPAVAPAPSVETIVNAVIAALSQGQSAAAPKAAAPEAQPAPASPAPAVKAATSPTTGSRHQDIIKF
jgi:photoactive yellow protein